MWRRFSLESVSGKFILLIESTHANSRSRVRAYNNLSPELTTISSVRQGCSLSFFFFSTVINMVMEIASSSCEISGIDVRSNRKLSDLEYADDFVVLSGDSSKLHVFAIV